MDTRQGWDPSIATLPRTLPGVLTRSGSSEADADGARAAGSQTPFGAAVFRSSVFRSSGFARRAALRERRLGWILWSGLVALLLVLSSH